MFKKRIFEICQNNPSERKFVTVQKQLYFYAGKISLVIYGSF